MFKAQLSTIMVVLVLVLCFNNSAQEDKKYKIHTIAFYNLENLFHTINDPKER